MENLNINPMGLKGRQINERMRELMGISSINENTSKSAVELTKIGPDGKAYAIVRENHEYYIKVSNKTTNLVNEDFKYIGGLQNKKSEAYPSYAKAIKHLNLNFKSLAEAYGKGGDINVFVDDNLINENAIAGGFSSHGGNGFSGAGNLEGNTALFEEEDKNNPWAICTASVGREDKEKYEACVRDVKKEKGIDESITEESYCNSMDEVEVELSEAEKAIDKMLEEDELVGNQDKLDADKDGDIEADDLADLRAGKKVNESRLSIEVAIDSIDDVIDALKKKVQ
ncbi:MAG: hypothetical protein E6R13_05830 [Spirochaetes bacterium]|nr:MAG: hypothetical protein E6R13_05830 [Spirochaetota bacterium]